MDTVTNPRQSRLAGIENKLQRIEAVQRRLAVVDRRFFLVRVGLMAAGLVALLTSLLFQSNWMAGSVLVGFIVLFVAVILLHRRVEQRQRQFRLLHSFHRTQLARMHLDWPAIRR
jgi:Flp pilus assembly protein TadB